MNYITAAVTCGSDALENQHSTYLRWEARWPHG